MLFATAFLLMLAFHVTARTITDTARNQRANRAALRYKLSGGAR